MTNTNLTQSLASVVRELMQAQGRSVNNLAASTGIPFSTLNRRLTGKSPFTTAELDAVATELGTTIADVFADVQAKATAA